MKQPLKQEPVQDSKFRKKLPKLSALIIFVIAGLLLTVWKISQWQVGSSPLKVEEKARIDAETSARTALIQGIGGLLVFATAGVSWLNLKATQRNVLVAEEKQITERFSKAVEMLSNESSIHTRLGGIYALKRIAKDSAKDHRQVMEVLTAFVREKTQLKDKRDPVEVVDHLVASFEEMQCNSYSDETDYDETDSDKESFITRTPTSKYIYPTLVDIQAVLTVVGRRIKAHENGEHHNLDLSRTDLRGVILIGDLAGINFEEVDFRYARLRNVNLSETILVKSNFELAKFEKVNLKNANLEEANLHWVKFVSTDFSQTNLKGANLSETDFQESNLAYSILTEANFSDAKLSESTRATLKQANLEKVDFSRVDLNGINESSE